MTVIDAHQPTTNRRPRRQRRRLAALVALGTVTVGAAAAAAVVGGSEEATQAAAFACVADGVTAVLPNDGTPPVDACASMWEQGSMAEGVAAAPPLVACVNAKGAVEVVTGDGPSSCGDAGLVGPWAEEAEYAQVGEAVRTALISFHDRYQATGNGCATEADWRQALTPALAPTGWNIELDLVEPDRHCIAFGSADPTTRTVTVIGVPDDYSIDCDPRTGC